VEIQLTFLDLEKIFKKGKCKKIDFFLNHGNSIDVPLPPAPWEPLVIILYHYWCGTLHFSKIKRMKKFVRAALRASLVQKTALSGPWSDRTEGKLWTALCPSIHPSITTINAFLTYVNVLLVGTLLRLDDHFLLHFLPLGFVAGKLCIDHQRAQHQQNRQFYNKHFEVLMLPLAMHKMIEPKLSAGKWTLWSRHLTYMISLKRSGNNLIELGSLCPWWFST